MAKIEFEGFGEYRARLMQLDTSLEGIIKRSVYPAAGMLIEEIKKSTPVDSPSDPNNLRESSKLMKFQNEDGFIYTGVYFTGYDENGTPNALKARAIESGHSSPKGGIVGKHPFIRPAVNRVKRQVQAMIQQNLDKYIEETMNK